MLAFSESQAEALITDSGTLKRGRELAKPANWSNLGRNDTAAWGECAGSGKNPYQVGVDLADIAFKCSCPSRVFPCKHGAGLLLLLARQPALLPVANPAAWIAEWLGKRQTRQEKQAEKTIEVTDAPKSAETLAKEAAARDKREAQRLDRMQRGATELETWLTDFLRTGLAAAPTQPTNFWEKQAARLVDDQLPGLAARVRSLAGLTFAGADWPDRLLAELSELLLLSTAFRHWAKQPALVQAELAQQVGWALKKEEVMAEGEHVHDNWQVLVSYTQDVPDNPRLEQRTTWLLGRRTYRLAKLLDFSAIGQPYPTHYASLSVVEGEVVFYPGLLPIRAITGADGLKNTAGGSEKQLLPTRRTINDLLDDYANALARNPWLREYPTCLAEVQLVPDGNRWWAVDASGNVRLPMEVPGNELGPYDLLAQQGPSLNLFGTWDGSMFRAMIGAAGNDPEVSFADDNSGGGLLKIVTDVPEQADVLETVPRWEELRRVALVGTRQAGTLPTLGTSLPLDQQADAETQFLQAAGSLSLMRRAGYLPTKVGQLPPPFSEAEVRPEASAAVGRCLRKMLVKDAPQELLPAYLEQLAVHGKRIPSSNLLLTLIWAGHHGKGLDYLPDLLGARGRWVASLNPDWQHLTKTAAAFTAPAIWETGTLPERRRYLATMLQVNPEQARTLLAAALPGEPAKGQAELLSALTGLLLPEDEALLESLLKSRSKEVRQTATRLLVRIPNAALVERLWARAVPLVQLKKGLLSKGVLGVGGPSLEITLPGDWSKEWLLDGIEERTEGFRAIGEKDQALGERTMRLGAILALIPPSRWETHLQLSAAELVDLARLSEWMMPLLPAWASAAILHQDITWATALLRLHLDPPLRIKRREVLYQIDWQGLAQVLTPQQWQQHLIKLLADNLKAAEEWHQKAALVPAPWPEMLTRAVIREIQRLITAPPTSSLWYLHGFFQTIGHYTIADEDTRWAARMLAEIPPSNDYQLNRWLQELLTTLEFRHELRLSLQDA